MNKNILTLVGVLAVIILGVIIISNKNRQQENTSSQAVDTPATETATENVAANLIEPAAEAPEVAIETSLPLADGNYNISVTESSLNWEGRKPKIMGYKDLGTLNLKSGNLQVENGSIIGGNIVIDMETLVATTVGKGGTEGLTKHLKSADFFDTENFKEANIKLLSITPSLASSGASGSYDLTTEITIKGITNTVVIPAQMTSENNQLTLSGHAELDRTLWNVRYGSGKFFENLADNVIDDFFGVDFRFVANLQ